MPKDQVSGLSGIMQAIQAMTAKVGVGWLAPVVAALVTLNALGAHGRLVRRDRAAAVRRRDRPFPAEGLRRSAPDLADAVRRAAGAGGDRGPVRLSRPGRDVGPRRLRRARLDGDHRVFHPVPVHVRRDDRAAARAGGAGRDARARRQAGGDPAGGRPGFIVTAVSIVLACIPPDDEPNKMLAVVKVVGSSAMLVGVGAIVYWLGRRRARSG